MPDLDLASHRRAVHPKREAYARRWTKYDDEDRAAPPKRVVTPLPKAWCYLCDREHPWEEPCAAQERLMAEWAQSKRRRRKVAAA